MATVTQLTADFAGVRPIRLSGVSFPSGLLVPAAGASGTKAAWALSA